MRKYLLLISILLITVSPYLLGQATLFTEYFDAYTAGEKLACQNGTDWTTWSNAPCGNEDGTISSAQYSSASKSLLILPNVDQVKPIDNLTNGNYSVVLKFYVPAGKSGYFNVLHKFVHNTGSIWAFECYLNPNGTATINAGGTNAAAFNYTQDAWHTIEVKANMVDTLDIGSFYVDAVTIHTWQWSKGATGSENLKQLGGVNFYGAESTNELYIDDLQIWNNLGTVGVEDYDQFPSEYVLYQNYPNPFNPTTDIIYSVAEPGTIKISVFNLLGEEVAVLIDSHKERGTYQVSFDASSFTSGTYIYRLESNGAALTKKMILIK